MGFEPWTQDLYSNVLPCLPTAPPDAMSSFSRFCPNAIEFLALWYNHTFIITVSQKHKEGLGVYRMLIKFQNYWF